MMPISFLVRSLLRIGRDNNLKPAVGAERQVVLADLVVLGQVGVIVVLAVPLGEGGDRQLSASPSAGPARTPGGSSPAAARHADADRTNVSCWAIAEMVAVPAEHLGRRRRLDVYSMPMT